ncbi:gamma-glutamyl-gamma-aminobutyrate hydrolase family protein [Aeromonas veronii]|uniref:Gamma-glutamyl-gamma-aminobutyrate hydrolase n=1 Tax=Aeromonas veronii TaxID=654 RepID=A0ABY3MM23_AERVE|nr:gamma-glutamyl-gamma-aminobutyrate hydrolase family protein [Aeromonas veronii]RDU83441.1 gamma-glutamyl-gamma-aminobutyrate hydrolase [Aeromonas veronii]RDU84396.1 gamma-glutamyl-gamma-aminobutyrate hydrolase [Aeromonas veronii]RDU85473.1 gamma-glutamyl-gamma-aminobutyrate hydrolase [Aeromonas veronii]RDU93151.1 gamma-glutamyl-gamma-aminobutyrate hydrolase [Aeromonas veronii]TEY50645.1 gamma-glutamyl-gamma-aminobutyrate hydrolase [Aeromonas veronii]
MPNPQPPAPRKPVVLMTMGAQPRNGHAYQVMTHKYIMPLVEISGCVPLLVPTCCGTADLEQYLDLADGIYLSGAGSNIDPALYGQENLTPEKQQDRDRDLFDLPLIKGALARGLPILGICRGMQEINVALGGDIHQKVYNEPGYDDHREDADDPVDEQYGPSHQIKLLPGSWFAELMGEEQIPVNSLHGQGINRLGKGLEPLAHAEDGLVEAIHAPTLSPFLLAVQWHPEWKASENPHSIKIFQAFGDACRQRCALMAAS